MQSITDKQISSLTYQAVKNKSTNQSISQLIDQQLTWLQLVTVWHQGMYLKLLRILPDVNCAMFQNRSLYVETSSGDRSHKRKSCGDDLPQGSVLALILFNIYNLEAVLVCGR